METRESFFEKLEFVGTGRSARNRSGADVSITLTVRNNSNDGKPNAISIAFRNDSYKNICKNQINKIRFAIYKNRMIFDENLMGYALTYNKANTSDNRYMRAHVDDTSAYTNCIGDYDMLFDEFYEYYYIDLTKKL